MRGTLLIARLEAQLLLASPFPLLLIVTPIIFMFFLSDGLYGGPARAVPGLSTMFGLFGSMVVGLVFFRDHGWNTWNRLRASSIHPVGVIVGKSLPFVFLFTGQQAVLLISGWAFFGMPWNGSLLAAAPLIGSVVAVQVSLGILAVAFCDSVEQLSIASYLGVLLFAGFGGALAPLSRLPEWVEKVSPASPVYWMQRGFRLILTRDHGAADLFGVVGCLVAFAVGALILSAWRFRFDTKKSYFA